jgi:AcrR family transcriptional regulator
MGDIARAAGISRQAVYLHFASRAELLEATTQYLDELLGLEQRLARSRAAGSGTERLDAYIEFWGNYIPEIYGVARALLVALDTDEATASAWNERMEAMRDGCRAAVEALESDGHLAEEWNAKTATELLWTMLSVRNWEQLTQECGWSSRKYIRWMKTMSRRTFVDEK